MRKAPSIFFLVATAACLHWSTGLAATFTWTGLGADNSILTSANWLDGLAPPVGSTLAFDGVNRLSPQLASPLSIKSIVFEAGAGAFTLGGAGTYTLTDGAGIENKSVNIQTINNSLILGADQAWSAKLGDLVIAGNVNINGKTLTIKGANDTTLSGILSGSGEFKASQDGVLTLTGANTYTGTTKLSTGTIAIGNDTAFGSSTVTLDGARISSTLGAHTLANSLVISNSTTFTAADNLTFNGNVSLTKGLALTTSGTGVITFNGVMGTGGRKVTKAGSGTLVLNGANTYTGGFVLTSGTFVAGSNTAAGTGLLNLGTATIQAGNGARTLANSVSITGNTTFSGANNLTFTGASNMTATRTLTVTNPVTTFSGVMSGAAGAGLIKTGVGTLVLSGTSSNTYNGPTLVNDGTLALGKTDGASPFASTVLTVGDNVGAPGSAVLRLDVSNQIPNAINVTMNADGQINVQSFTDQIAALNTTGGSVIGSGRLDLGGNITTTATGTNVTSISSGLGLNASRTFLVNDNAVTTDVDLSITGAIINGSGGRSITKTGLGTMLLGGASTYSGGTSVNNGTVLLDSSTTGAITSGPLGTAAATLGDTTGTNSASLLFSTGSGNTVANAITVRTGTTGNTLTLGGLNTSGVNTFSGNVTLAKSVTLTAAAGGEVAFNGVISGSTFGITKTGEGTVRLGGANTYTGLTTINAGTLAYGASNVISTGGVTIDGPTARLDLGLNRTDTVGQVILDNGGSITGTGTSTLSSTAPFDVRSGSASVILGGSVALTKTTTGSVILSGVNTYTGATNVSAGTLQLDVANSIPSNSTVTVSGGATLDLNSNNQTVGSITGAGSVILGSGVLASGGNNTSTTFSGSISGTGGITKNGTGTLTLSGTSTYTGPTTINLGSVRPGPSGGVSPVSAVTVAGGASLDLNSSSATIGSLAGGGSVILGTATLATGGNHSSTTFSGGISGTGSLVKTGTGTMTLTGINSLTGPVMVDTGALRLSGTSGAAASASSFTVNGGASVILDNSAGENSNRISNTAPVTVGSGTMQFISDSNGSTESVGALNVSTGLSTISVTHNGAATDSTSLTFSSLGTRAPGATVDFMATGGVLGSNSTGPHIYITSQPTGLMGGWATVGTDFAEYYVDGVRAFSNYYSGNLGVNLNDPTKIIVLSSTSPLGAYTLTNAGTTTDNGLKLTDLALVDLNTSATRTLNLSEGGLIKTSAPDTTISGLGRLTAGGTADGTLYTTIEAARTLTIASSIINNAGADGIYGNAGDGVVSLSKSGTGTLVLSGANTYTGSNYLNAGTLSISADQNLGSAGSAVIFGGGTLHVSSGLTAAATRAFTVAAEVTGTIDVASGQTFTLGNAANLLTTGNQGSILFKSGAGTLVVQGANAAFDGTLQINSGTVELRDALSLGDATNRGVAILAGGTLELRNDTSTTFANAVSLIADSTIRGERLSGVSPGVTHTLGALTIGANTLTIASDSNATLALSGIALTGNATISTTTTSASSGAITGGFGFTKSGAGNLTLLSAGTYTGATTVTGGTLTLGVAGGVTSTSAVTIGSSGTFNVNSLAGSIGSLAGAGSVTLGSGTLTTGNDDTSTAFSGIVSGTGGLTKTGTGVLTLSGVNTYTGVTTVSTGSLQLGASGVISNSSAVSIASGAVFDLNNFSDSVGSITGSGTISLGSGTLTTGGDNTSTTFSGDVTGSGGLTKTGVGTLSLSSASSYAGGTTVAGGILTVQNAAALGSVLGGTTVAAGGELRIAPGLTVNAEPLTLNGAGVAGAGALRTLGGGAAWTGPITLGSNSTVGSDSGLLTIAGAVQTAGSTLTLTGAGDILANGTITGSGGLVKSGSGTLTLDAANTFTGSVLVDTGILRVGNDNALGGASSTVVASGAMIQFSNGSGVNVGTAPLTISGTGIGNVGVLHNIAGGNSWAGDVTLAADSSIGVDAGTSLKLSGAIGESGGPRTLTKIGTGTLILSGTADYSGATLINTGTLQMGSSGSMSAASAVTIATGATLDLNSFNQTIGSLTGTGTVDFGSGATGSLTVGGNDSSTTFSGTITNLGDLIKAGSGTLILSGNNTFTGGITIDNGILSAALDANLGDGANPITINAGTLRASATFTSGRVIYVGDPTSAIDVNAAQTLTLTAGINGTESLNKTGAGTLILTGASTYTGDTNITTGTLTVGSGGSLTSANVSVSAGTTLNVASSGQLSTSTALANQGLVNFNASSAAIASVTGSSGSVLTLNSTNLSIGSGTIAGVIQNGASAGRLTKTGVDTLVLSGANTYSGTTTVAGGSLVAASNTALGTTAAATTVASGASLGLDGSAGALSIAEEIFLSGAGLAGGPRGALENIAGNNTITEEIALNAASTITSTAGTLTLTGGITNGGFLTTFDGADNIVITTAKITGSGGLTKNGTGTTTLGVVNNYTGPTTVNAGTLNITAIGEIASTVLNVNNGGTLNVASGGTLPNSVAVTNSGSLNLNSPTETFASLSGASTGILTLNSTTLTVSSGNYAGIIQDGTSSASLFKANDGTLTLGGVNTYTGTTTIDKGILQVNGSLAAGSTVNVLSDGTLSGTGTVHGNTTLTGSGVINLSSGAVIGGTLGVTGGFWNGAGSVTGAVTSSSNTFTIGAGANLTANGEVFVTGGTIFASAVTSTITGSLIYTSSSDSTFNGVIAGAGETVTLNNADAELTLGGTSTYTGVTTVTAGALTVTKSGALGSTAGGTIIGSGTVLGLDGSAGALSIGAESLRISGTGLTGAPNGALRNIAGNNTFAGPITLDAASTITTSAGTLNLTGGVNNNGFLASFESDGVTTISTNGISGTGGLSMIGGGTLNLNVANSYSGTTTVADGTLAIGATGSLTSTQVSISNGATLSVANGGLLSTATALNATGTAIFNSPAATISSLDGPGSGRVTLNTTNLTVSSGTFDGIIQNGASAGSLTKTGAGTLTLSSSQTYTGATHVNGGTLNLTGQIAAGSTVNISGTGTLAGTGTVNGNATLTGTGVIHLGSGGLIKGTLGVTGGSWNGLGEIDGLVTSSSGTFTIGTGANLIANGNLNVTGGTLAGTGTITGNVNYASSADSSFGGVIAGNKTLTVNNASGSLTLSSTQTYTGATTITSGELVVDGGAGGTLGGTEITVGSSGLLRAQGNTTLGLSGAGSVVVNAGGTLSLEDGTINTLTLANTGGASNNLTLGGTVGNPSLLSFDLGNTTTDLLNVGRRLVVNPGGAVISLNQIAGTTMAEGIYPLITYSSRLLTGTFTLDNDKIRGRSFTLLTSPTAESIAVGIIPTPPTAYWTGSQDSVWNSFGPGSNTNFTTDPTGLPNTYQLPGSISDVFFTANSGSNLNTTLGQDFSIKSLTFTSTGTTAGTSSTSIGGANTLTLGTGGLTVQTGSAAHTISANVALGAAQSWTNNSTSPLTISGSTNNGGHLLTITGTGSTTISSISGSGGLTKNGISTLTLNGTSTYTGETTLNSGTLALASAGAIGDSGTINFGGGVLQFSAANTTDYSARFSTAPAQAYKIDTNGQSVLFGTALTSSAGTLEKSGTGTLTLNASNTYTGATTVNGGNLQVGLSGAGTTGSGTMSVITGQLVGTGNVLSSSVIIGTGAVLQPGDITSGNNTGHGTLTFTPAVAGSYDIHTGAGVILGISSATNHGNIDPFFGGHTVGSAGYNAYVDAVSGAGSHDRVVFNGSTGSSLVFNGSITISDTGFTPQVGQVFNLLDWTSGVSANFSGFSPGTTFRDGSTDNGSQLDLPDISASGLWWDVSRLTTSGNISIIVPEPHRAVLLLIGLWTLIFSRRRAKNLA